MGNSAAVSHAGCTPAHRSEPAAPDRVQRPDPVVHLFQADLEVAERIGEEQQLPLESDGAAARHPFDQEVARVLRRRDPLRERPRREPVARCGRPPPQIVVGPLFIVFLPKLIEGSLLRGETPARRADRARLEGLVHAFVGPVLLTKLCAL